MKDCRFVATGHLREASTGYFEMMRNARGCVHHLGFFHASLHLHQVIQQSY
jgi:hypothetical protein